MLQLHLTELATVSAILYPPLSPPGFWEIVCELRPRSCEDRARVREVLNFAGVQAQLRHRAPELNL